MIDSAPASRVLLSPFVLNQVGDVMNVVTRFLLINQAIHGAKTLNDLATNQQDEDLQIAARHACNMYIDLMLALLEVHKALLKSNHQE